MLFAVRLVRLTGGQVSTNGPLGSLTLHDGNHEPRTQGFCPFSDSCRTERLGPPLVIDGGWGACRPAFSRHRSPTRDFSHRRRPSMDGHRAERGHKGRPRRRHGRRSPGASRIPQRPLTDGDGATPGEALMLPPRRLPANAPTEPLTLHGRDHEPFHQPKDSVR